MDAFKTRENRLRRMADRQGLRLIKSRTRDHRGLDYGLYALVDLEHGGTVHSWLADRWPYALTLEDVEGWLTDFPEEVEAA